MITLVTAGWCSSQASATCATRGAPRLGDRAQRVDDASGAVAVDRREVEARPPPVAAAPSPVVLARQEAAGQRAPDHQADAFRTSASARSRARGRGRPACNRPAASGPARSRGARRCPAPWRPARPPSSRRRRSAPGPGARARRAHRSVSSTGVDRDRSRGSGRGRCGRAAAASGSPSTSRGCGRATRRRRSGPGPCGRTPWSRHHLVPRDAEIAQRLAGDRLRQALGIDVRGVDEVDAGIERRADQAVGLLLPQPADLAARCLSPPPKVMVPRQSSETKRPVSAEGVVAHEGELS